VAQHSPTRRAAGAALDAAVGALSPRSDADPVDIVDSAINRADDLAATIGGLGNANYDKTAGSNRSIGKPRVLKPVDLDFLYEGDVYARRIVDVPPRECTRRGWSVYAAAGDADAGAEPFADELRRLGVTNALRERDQWARLYGGAAIVLDVDDGMDDPLAPLDLARVQQLRSIRVLDMHELRVLRCYGQPGSMEVAPPGMLGEPSVYQIQPHDAFADFNTEVHESRVLIQVGQAVSRRRRTDYLYYGKSNLGLAVEKLLNLSVADRSIANIVEEFRLAMLGVKGLSTLSQSKDGTKKLMKRLRAFNLGKSVAKLGVIDADSETFTQQGAPVTGLPDIYDRLQQGLAAATDGMPLDLIFGTSPKGLGSSNESGRKHWQDVVAGRQRSIYEPSILTICDILRASGVVDVPDDAPLRVEFAPLEEPTEKERAETREIQSRADERYMKWNVLAPAEVRAGRFSGVGWSSDTRLLDPDDRSEMSLANDEPAVPPPGGGAE